jgi:oligoendopeptidase F
MNLSNIQSIWQKTEQRSSETESSTVRKAEDVVSSMLAKGYVLSKDALNVAKTFDERHQLLSNASATVASLDRQIGLSDKISAGTALVSGKMREVDERFQVSTFRGGGGYDKLL